MKKKILCIIAALSFVTCNSFPVMAQSRKFKATAYCGCRKCNGKWTGQPTASGTDYKEGRTVAVDKYQIPLGMHVWVNGKEYVAEDTGSGIGWDCIDIYFDSHSDALDFGIKYVTVEW